MVGVDLVFEVREKLRGRFCRVCGLFVLRGMGWYGLGVFEKRRFMFWLVFIGYLVVMWSMNFERVRKELLE